MKLAFLIASHHSQHVLGVTDALRAEAHEEKEEKEERKKKREGQEYMGFLSARTMCLS